MKALALLLALSACTAPQATCNAGRAAYLTMVAGGAHAGALELAREDVRVMCLPPARPE